jgi:osmotically-inducible protein OsmY
MEATVQTINLNNTNDLHLEARPRNLEQLPLAPPRRVLLFTALFALTATLLTTGCARHEGATHESSVAAHSEAVHPEHEAHHPIQESDRSAIENTGHNSRDRGNATLTPTDQKENRRDIRITAAIRKSVLKHKGLSSNAHNAKIITRDGVVTLRGPVENLAESNKLQSLAHKVRGVKQVHNQLETKTP